MQTSFKDELLTVKMFQTSETFPFESRFEMKRTERVGLLKKEGENGEAILNDVKTSVVLNKYLGLQVLQNC